MQMQSKPPPAGSKDDATLQVQELHVTGPLKTSSDLQFTKLQPSDEELNQESEVFGCYVAREAILDEEYWTAAWLRAESHWEDRPNERYAESYKRQFAEQTYSALKRRCNGFNGQSSMCIVTVKKEEKDVKRTVIKSVVGTLDLSIRYMSQGGSFPGERKISPFLCSIEEKKPSKYGYIANLCVAKSSRRKGIAINMMKFAMKSAKLKGADQIFVHVHRKNTAAQVLYRKLGFKMVDIASQQLDEEQMYLLCIKT